MSSRTPGPGEELTDGVVTRPRPAATVMVLREGDGGLEVLLVQRTHRARFMAGAWVFPGGAVDPGDGEGQAGLRAAAVREVAEEAGIDLGDCELVAFSNWVTPAEVRIRYDTWFYLTVLPAGGRAQIDGDEIIDARWMVPAEAIAAAERDELSVVFPTRRHLELLARYAAVEALLEATRGRPVTAVQPRIIGSGEQARIVLPGEPGYERT